jgi:hypothetical protein
VKKDKKIMERMLKLSNGTRQVPVIVRDNEVLIGYDGT